MYTPYGIPDMNIDDCGCASVLGNGKCTRTSIKVYLWAVVTVENVYQPVEQQLL